MKNKKPIFKKKSDGVRVLIVGQSGSGKSHHSRLLIAEQSEIPFLVFDFKDDDNIQKHFYKLGERVAKTSDYSKVYGLLKQYSIVIFTPSISYTDDDISDCLIDFYNRVRNCGVLFDEAYLLPDCIGVKTLLTRGRSRGLSVISCSQRPVVMPSVCRSESQKIYIHRLTLPQDCKTMYELTGIPVQQIRDLKGYDFLTSEV